MNVTVCQLPDQEEALRAAWEDLADHVREQRSELLLLPELPFAPWPCGDRRVHPDHWYAVMQYHDEWIGRLPELGVPTIAASRPVIHHRQRKNEGFVWEDSRVRTVHHKRYLPDEEFFWEASVYAPGDGQFAPANTAVGPIGFLICTELWFSEHARDYGRQGVRFLLCPRATKAETREKWLVGGRAAAIRAGAWCLSSNRGGDDWAGCGWIIEPESGAVLATTDATRPFVTLDIDPTAADRAQTTYPRYVDV